MDEGALRGFLRLLFVLFTVYVWWSLFSGNLYLPNKFAHRRPVIDRSITPRFFWAAWTVLLCVWVYALIKVIGMYTALGQGRLPL